MLPQTPRHANRAPSGYTPNFSLDAFGQLPSFRLTPPRNLAFSSTLTPSRFFDPISRQHCDKGPLEESQDQIALGANLSSSFESTLQLNLNQSFENESIADSMTTADSVDIWSFTNDTKSQSGSLGMIKENPELSLLITPEHFPRALTETKKMHSPITLDEAAASVSKKRRLSVPSDSPCGKLATLVAHLPSPTRKRTLSVESDFRSSKKVWSKSLDEELMRCFHKLNAYKQDHGSDSVVFRNTTQNKTISKMLLRKCGIIRTPKQIAARLQKISKTEASLTQEAESNLLLAGSRHALSTSTPKKNDFIGLWPTITDLNLTFKYTNAMQPTHSFIKASQQTGQEPNSILLSALKELFTTNNTKLGADLDNLAPSILRHNATVHHIICKMDLNAEVSKNLSPISPMTNPRQFTTDNGRFLSTLRVAIRKTLEDLEKATYKVTSTVYKGENRTLLQGTESINGYHLGHDTAELYIPFLQKFWAGFLTFVANGSNDTDEIRDLTILQLLYEDQESEKKIFGLLIYQFQPAPSQLATAEITSFELKLEDSREQELDDLETILASSPLRSPPQRSPAAAPHLLLNIDVANRFDCPGPMSAPPSDTSGLPRPSLIQAGARVAARPIMPQTKSSMTRAEHLHYQSGFGDNAQHVMSCNSAGRNPSDGQCNEMGFEIMHNTQAPPLQPPPHSDIPPEHQMMQNFHESMPVHYHGPPSQPLLQQTVPPPINRRLAAPANYVHQFWHEGANNSGMSIPLSAPAGQMHFFTQDPPQLQQRSLPPAQPKSKFGPMLQYDPSVLNNRAARLTSKEQSNFHTFQQDPGLIFRQQRM